MRISAAITVICGVLTVIAFWQSTHGGPVPTVSVIWFAVGTTLAAVLTLIVAWLERK